MLRTTFNVSSSSVRQHLDRLIHSDTGKWQLFARRARSHSAQQRFDSAAADYAHAAQLLKKQANSDAKPLYDWYKHRALVANHAEDWKVARWYLELLVSVEPNEPCWQLELAEIAKKSQ